MSTEKTQSREEMRTFLTQSTQALLRLNKDDLALDIEKALKKSKTTNKELADLVKEVTDALTPATTVATTFEPISDTTTQEQTAKPEKKPAIKPASNKSSTTSKKADNSTKKPIPTAVKEKCPMATMFPDTLTFGSGADEVNLVKAGADQFSSASMVSAYIAYCDHTDPENYHDLYLACYWTKRQIKQYDYSRTFNVPISKDFKFKNDLDMVRSIAYAGRVKRLWGISEFTDAMYYFEESDFEPVEDVNPYNGEKYQIRVSNGMEFEIYIDIRDTQKVSDFITAYNAEHNSK